MPNSNNWSHFSQLLQTFEAAQYQDKILTEEIGISVLDKWQMLNDLANLQLKTIQVEREAFNLKDGKMKQMLSKKLSFTLTIE